MKTRDITAVFWDTQGKIKYNTEQSFFNYETSMSINWNNKVARKVLINLLQIFNTPNILYLQANGIALWDNNNLSNLMFYNKKLLFYEISIRDKYVVNNNNTYNTEYPFLECKYIIKINKEHIKILSQLYNYINYDSFINCLIIKSRTLEENLITLDLFLRKKIKSQDELVEKKNKVMNKLDKMDDLDFNKNIKLLIENINNFILQNNLLIQKNISYE